MRHRSLKYLFALSAFGAACADDSQMADYLTQTIYASRAPDMSNKYIVVLRSARAAESGAAAARTLSEIRAFAADYRLEPRHMYPHAFERSGALAFAAEIPAERLAAVASDPRTWFIEPDQPVKVDMASPRSPDTQIVPAGVRRIAGEVRALSFPLAGTGIDVAVLDTGLDLTHPELLLKIAGGKDCLTDDGQDSYDDDHGHGSHVAGTIAAANNYVGVVGVAAGVRLWAVKVLDKYGYGTTESVICGADYVASMGPANGGPIRVANMSLGGWASVLPDNECGATNMDAEHMAICGMRDAGVVVVVSAGNNSFNTKFQRPAGYDDAVITVSALADSDGEPCGHGQATSEGDDDTFAGFSNYGDAVDIGAPGVDVLSASKNGGYRVLSGTSMAAPHVTAVVAIYLRSHPNATWTEVRDALRAAGEYMPYGHTDPTGRHSEPVLRIDHSW